MVYDSEGNILSCTGSGNTLKKEIYKDLSFDKALFEGAADFALSSLMCRLCLTAFIRGWLLLRSEPTVRCSATERMWR